METRVSTEAFTIPQRPDIPYGQKLSPAECWQLVYEIAWGGIGQVRSNPLVGAVLTSEDGRLLAAACHKKFGDAHAERALIVPLLDTHGPEFFRGSTLYVSLEPCAHYGKTPSCARLISRLPFARVLYAETDPNPMVAGKGAAMILGTETDCRAVSTGLPFWRLTERANYNLHNKLPFVGLKIARSQDGTVGRKGASRFWITGAEAMEYSHWLRQIYDGILVGSGTLLTDNPALNVRIKGAKENSPVKVILDLRGQAAGKLLSGFHFRIFDDEAAQIIWIIEEKSLNCSEIRELRKKGIRLILMPSPQAQDAGEILKQLCQDGLSSLLVEGGPRTWDRFLRSGHVQRLHLIESPDVFAEQDHIRYPGPPCLCPEPDKKTCWSLGRDMLTEYLYPTKTQRSEDVPDDSGHE